MLIHPVNVNFTQNQRASAPTSDYFKGEQVNVVKQSNTAFAKAKKPKVYHQNQIGYPNLNAKTCWFNSLLQTFFKPGSIYFNALEEKVWDKSQANRAIAYILWTVIRLSHGYDCKENLKQLDVIFNHPPYKIDLNYLYNQFLLHFTEAKKLDENQEQDLSEGLCYLVDFLQLEKTKAFASASFKLSHFIQAKDETERKTETTTTNTSQLILSDPNISSIKEGLIDMINSRDLIDEYRFDANKTSEPAYKIDFISESQAKDLKQVTLTAPRFIHTFGANGNFVGQKNSKRIRFETLFSVPIYDDDKKELKGHLKLKLKSVAVHFQLNKRSGHYVSYAFNLNGSMTLYDDQKITHLGEIQEIKEALKIVEKNGYLASYSSTYRPL